MTLLGKVRHCTALNMAPHTRHSSFASPLKEVLPYPKVQSHLALLLQVPLLCCYYFSTLTSAMKTAIIALLVMALCGLSTKAFSYKRQYCGNEDYVGNGEASCSLW